MVVFFRFIEAEDKETGEVKTIPLLKYYHVFHISQCQGREPRFASSVPFHSDLKPDEKAEKIFLGYLDRSGVRLQQQNSNKAYYSPALDTIVIPQISQFDDVAEFYSTGFHETVHSTGHPSRLNRISDVARFGSESYSKEELTAELGSSYLVNTAGLETPSSFQNSAAYISNWLSALKNDKRLIVSAAGKAEQAVKMIFGEQTLESDAEP